VILGLTIVAASLSAALLLAGVAIEHHRRRRMAKYVEEYRRLFPGRCPVCGYRRFAMMFADRPIQYEPHECPEAAPARRVA
jgi:DNA-directed RNA polymerase subunit RPC12/RpoP